MYTYGTIYTVYGKVMRDIISINDYDTLSWIFFLSPSPYCK